jgi:hypothetical protein
MTVIAHCVGRGIANRTRRSMPGFRQQRVKALRADKTPCWPTLVV